MRRAALGLALGVAAAAPAAGQGVRPEDVAQGFVEGVVLCAEARVEDGVIGDLDPARLAALRPAAAAARDFLGIPDEAEAYEVVAGGGVVIVHETAEGRCQVEAYGPRVAPTFAFAFEALVNGPPRFDQTANELTSAAYIRRFERRMDDGDRVRIVLDGGEPGMEGRLFRFPMLLGLVTRD